MSFEHASIELLRAVLKTYTHGNCDGGKHARKALRATRPTTTATKRTTKRKAKR